jgi:hypothetical protein
MEATFRCASNSPMIPAIEASVFSQTDRGASRINWHVLSSLVPRREIRVGTFARFVAGLPLRELACLKAMFNFVINSGCRIFNPVSRVKFLSEGNEQTRVLSYEEQAKYLEHASRDLKHRFEQTYAKNQQCAQSGNCRRWREAFSSLRSSAHLGYPCSRVGN